MQGKTGCGRCGRLGRHRCGDWQQRPGIYVAVSPLPPRREPRVRQLRTTRRKRHWRALASGSAVGALICATLVAASVSREAHASLPARLDPPQTPVPDSSPRPVPVVLGWVDPELEKSVSLQMRCVLTDPTQPPEARADAAQLLGDLQTPLATPALLAALNDPHPLVRTAAAVSLEGLGYRGALGGSAPLAAAALCRALTCDTDALVRGAAVCALAEVGDVSDVGGFLVSALRDPDPRVRQAAAKALHTRRCDIAAPWLGDVLDDDADPRVRFAAAETLGSLGTAAADEQPALSAAVYSDPCLDVRDAAAASLIALRNDGVELSPSAQSMLRAHAARSP